jgi:hypothetical protein
MNKTLVSVLKGLVVACGLALSLGATPALAQVEIRLGPPATFRATTRPYYYQGRATYWYGGRWHYREGRDWRVYREEPRELRSHRGYDRRHYERGGRGDRR